MISRPAGTHLAGSSSNVGMGGKGGGQCGDWWGCKGGELEEGFATVGIEAEDEEAAVAKKGELQLESSKTPGACCLGTHIMFFHLFSLGNQ